MTAELLAPPPYGSSEWVAWRTNGLGASDLPTLVGCNPWQGEYALWSAKTGQTAPEPETAAMRWGHRMEALGIEVYQETTGLPVITGETFANPRWPHAWATLDGRVDRRGIEVKYSGRAWDGIPQRVQVQALGQMGIGELEAVDIVVLSNHGEPTVHRIERDEQAITDLLDLAEAWWDRYVIRGEQPPYDGSPEARRALDRLRGDAERSADDTQLTLLSELRSVRSRLAVLTKLEEAIERDLKASMAGTGILTAPGARVTWSAVRGRSTTDWKAVALTALPMLPGGVGEDMVARHTTTGEPTTRFAVKYAEEE